MGSSTPAILPSSRLGSSPGRPLPQVAVSILATPWPTCPSPLRPTSPFALVSAFDREGKIRGYGCTGPGDRGRLPARRRRRSRCRAAHEPWRTSDAGRSRWPERRRSGGLRHHARMLVVVPRRSAGDPRFGPSPTPPQRAPPRPARLRARRCLKASAGRPAGVHHVGPPRWLVPADRFQGTRHPRVVDVRCPRRGRHLPVGRFRCARSRSGRRPETAAPVVQRRHLPSRHRGHRRDVGTLSDP